MSFADLHERETALKHGRVYDLDGLPPYGESPTSPVVKGGPPRPPCHEGPGKKFFLAVFLLIVSVAVGILAHRIYN